MARKDSVRRKSTADFDWTDFLRKFSRDLIRDVSIREDLPREVIDSECLGFEGATEAKIAALENRIGKTLPPSYRQFLATSDGWRDCGTFIYRLWPCSEVAWFHKRNQEWIDAYSENIDEEEISDREYLIYGSRQNPCLFPRRYLQTALEISDIGDSAILLLNPEVVSDEGEWEAWFFANWIPGAERYRSFRELMEAQRRSFRKLLNQLGSGKSKYGNAGQQAARAGRTDEALELLRQLAASGDISSLVSLAQLCAFRGIWKEVIDSLGQVLLNLGEVRDHEDAQGDLIRLSGQAGHETGNWRAIARIAKAAIVAEEAREYDQYHELARTRFLTLYRNLEKYARRRGAPPHELVYVFGVADVLEGWSEAQRRSRYDEALTEPHMVKYRSKPLEYARHCFSLAQNLRLDDEMLRISGEHPAVISFRDALDVARARLRRNQPDLAWGFLQERIAQSVSGPEHVAPIILLVDELLRTLMTPARCEEVLSTPRGPVAPAF